MSEPQTLRFPDGLWPAIREAAAAAGISGSQYVFRELRRALVRDSAAIAAYQKQQRALAKINKGAAK